MAFPPDILLPSNAKYYAFVDTKLDYSPHWDINWSFTYALSAQEAGFSTFLTNFPPVTGWPGHYLGYSGNAALSSYLVTEDGEYILTESGERLLVESETGIGNNGILAIGFDSTGLFALSSQTRGGVGINSIKQNALVIRDAYDNVIFNAAISAMSSDFKILSSTGGGFFYQTLRIRYSQAGNKLTIDFKNDFDSKFRTLTSIVTRLVLPQDFGNVYVGFCYCSPISSTKSPGTFKLRNFHTQGNGYDANTEQTSFVPITASKLTNYTQLSSLSAQL